MKQFVLMGILVPVLLVGIVNDARADTIDTVSFTFTPSSPTPGQSIPFTGVWVGGTPPYTYSWVWGDGTANNEDATESGTVTVNHAFTSADSYTVQLTVFDVHGQGTNSPARIVTVSDFLGGGELGTPAIDQPSMDQPPILPVVGGSTLLIIGLGLVAYLGVRGRKRGVSF